MASPIKQYLDSTGRLPEDALLGYIAFTLGADGEHDRTKLVTEFENRGLDAAYVPPLSRAVDAFKKAIKNQQEYRYQMSRTTEGRVLFREVASPDPTVILRAIMREERNDVKSRLNYDKVGEVKLYRSPRRDGQTIDEGARYQWNLASNVADDERRRLLVLGGLIKGDYARYMTSLEGIRIRALILDYLRHELQSIPMKASVHFVPIQHAEKLHAFAEAISTLDGCKVPLVPLVDLVEQREHVLEALQEDTEKTLGDLLADLNRLRSSRASVKTYAALRQRFDAIMARSDHYAELLDLSAERTTGATDVAKQLLSQISREFLMPKEES